MIVVSLTLRAPGKLRQVCRCWQVLRMVVLQLELNSGDTFFLILIQGNLFIQKTFPGTHQFRSCLIDAIIIDDVLAVQGKYSINNKILEAQAVTWPLQKTGSVSCIKFSVKAGMWKQLLPINIFVAQG